MNRERPNVIWVFGDQHRAQALSCNGDPNVYTPNVDMLAANGVNFTRAISGFPLCCPFRGSLVTGRHPHKCVPGHEYPLPQEQETVANVFNQAGYQTAYFGKWHLDGFKEAKGRAAFHVIPPERRGGFQKWIGYENNNAQWDCWVHGGEGEDAVHYRLPGYETDELTNLLLDYLREQTDENSSSNEPFFAVLSVQPPHDPYQAPEEFMERHTPEGLTLRPNVPDIPRIVNTARKELAGYYAQIENLDWNLGRIRKVLEEEGLADNTYIMFFSDHGDMHGSHGQLRKTTPYEEAIRVPFIVGGPKRNSYYTGMKSTAPINHVDIAPTTLGLCGIEAPDWMEGFDYSACLSEGETPANEPDSAYLQCVVPTKHHNSVDKPWRGIVTRDGWKYVCLENTPWLLFNLNEDPFEQVNHAHNSMYRQERRRLNDQLREWVSCTEDEFSLPDPD